MNFIANRSFFQLISPSNPDTFGSIASGLCLFHCLITPFLFAAHLGIEEHHAASPIWWKYLDVFFLLLAFVAVYFSAKKTSISWVKYAMYSAWVALSLVLLNERIELFHWNESLIYFPTMALIGLHLYNHQYSHCNEENCSSDA